MSVSPALSAIVTAVGQVEERERDGCCGAMLPAHKLPMPLPILMENELNWVDCDIGDPVSRVRQASCPGTTWKNKRLDRGGLKSEEINSSIQSQSRQAR